MNLLESWIIPNAIPPKSVENSKVEYIVEDSEGNVEIYFAKEKKNIQPPRSSYSSVEQKIFNPPKTFSQNSHLTRSKSSVNLRSINHSSRVPEMFYENESKFKKNSQTFSPPLSPSYSQMAGIEGANSNIVVIIKEDFQINKIILREEFYYELNTEKRTWFFENFDLKTKQNSQEEFMDLVKEKIHTTLFTWFENYCSQKGIVILFMI